MSPVASGPDSAKLAAETPGADPAVVVRPENAGDVVAASGFEGDRAALDAYAAGVNAWWLLPAAVVVLLVLTFLPPRSYLTWVHARAAVPGA